jgi:hypothetical protein
MGPSCCAQPHAEQKIYPTSPHPGSPASTHHHSTPPPPLHHNRGSYVSALGATQVFPPRWSKNAPVDTCGAGDNYAAGLLYGLLQGMDVAHVSGVDSVGRVNRCWVIDRLVSLLRKNTPNLT